MRRTISLLVSTTVLLMLLWVAADASQSQHGVTVGRLMRLNEELMDAAFTGDLNNVKRLLAGGADVNYADQFGNSPLHRAIDGRRESVARLLLSAGANPNAADIIGSTPLHLAAGIGEPDVLQLLIINKADVNAATDEGETPLHWCANARIAQQLLDAQAQVNVADRHGTTPLHSASKLHRLDVVRVLLKAGAEVDPEDEMGWTPLFAAATKAGDDEVDLDTIAELLKAGANVAHKDAEGRSILHVAVGAAEQPLQQLLEHGASVRAVDVDGETPITVAARHCRLGVIRIYDAAAQDLVQAAVNGQTALDHLVDCQSLDAEALIRNACTVLRRRCKELERLLIRAAESEKVDLLERLLRDGVSPNCSEDRQVLGDDYKKETGVTALMVAALAGKVQAIRLLSSSGAVLDQTTSLGRTALSMAAGGLQLAPVELLLDLGASPNIQDVEGQTALMRNIAGDPFEMSYPEGEGSGCTGNTLIAKALLKHGASVSIKDKRGRTAADIARSMTCPIWSNTVGRYPGPNVILDLLSKVTISS